MAHVITAVVGSSADKVPIRTALLSVSDKAGLVELGKALASRGVLVRRARSASREGGCSIGTMPILSGRAGLAEQQ